ncbi:MAG TPA: hypothetical protein VIH35_08645, partial [Kiritimatiellia bacterium]
GDELARSPEGMVNNAGILQAGRWVGADLLVRGHFDNTKDSVVVLRMEVVDVPFADVLASDTVPFAVASDVPLRRALKDAERVAEVAGRLLDDAVREKSASRDAVRVAVPFVAGKHFGESGRDMTRFFTDALSRTIGSNRPVRIIRFPAVMSALDERDLAVTGFVEAGDDTNRFVDAYVWAYLTKSPAAISAQVYTWDGRTEPIVSEVEGTEDQLPELADRMAAAVASNRLFDSGPAVEKARIVDILLEQASQGITNTHKLLSHDPGPTDASVAMFGVVCFIDPLNALADEYRAQFGNSDGIFGMWTANETWGRHMELFGPETRSKKETFKLSVVARCLRTPLLLLDRIALGNADEIYGLPRDTPKAIVENWQRYLVDGLIRRLAIAGNDPEAVATACRAVTEMLDSEYLVRDLDARRKLIEAGWPYYAAEITRQHAATNTAAGSSVNPTVVRQMRFLYSRVKAERRCEELLAQLPADYMVAVESALSAEAAAPKPPPYQAPEPFKVRREVDWSDVTNRTPLVTENPARQPRFPTKDHEQFRLAVLRDPIPTAPDRLSAHPFKDDAVVAKARDMVNRARAQGGLVPNTDYRNVRYFHGTKQNGRIVFEGDIEMLARDIKHGDYVMFIYDDFGRPTHYCTVWPDGTNQLESIYYYDDTDGWVVDTYAHGGEIDGGRASEVGLVNGRADPQKPWTRQASMRGDGSPAYYIVQDSNGERHEWIDIPVPAAVGNGERLPCQAQRYKYILDDLLADPVLDAKNQAAWISELARLRPGKNEELEAFNGYSYASLARDAVGKLGLLGTREAREELEMLRRDDLAGEHAVTLLRKLGYEDVPLPAAFKGKDTTAKLKACYDLVNGGRSGSPEFFKAVRTLQPSFQEITPGLVYGTCDVVRCSLNSKGARFDAVRFHAPEGYRMNFAWLVAFPPNSLGNFYIAPAEGLMKGFEYFDDSKYKIYTNPAWPTNYTTISQTLDAGRIKPGQDYILWFTFRGNDPVDCYIAINLYPDSPANDILVWHPVEHTLGIDFENDIP